MEDRETAGRFVAEFCERVAEGGPTVEVFRCTALAVLAELDHQTREAALLRERLAAARAALARAAAALEAFEGEPGRRQLTLALVVSIRRLLEEGGRP